MSERTRITPNVCGDCGAEWYAVHVCGQAFRSTTRPAISTDARPERLRSLENLEAENAALRSVLRRYRDGWRPMRHGSPPHWFGAGLTPRGQQSEPMTDAEAAVLDSLDVEP